MRADRKRFFIPHSLLAFVILFSLFIHASHSTDKANETVLLNVRTYKVHKMSCIRAKQCTHDCIAIKRKDAYIRGGMPCEVCEE